MSAGRPLPVITGTIVLDLSRTKYEQQRRTIHAQLYNLQPGDQVRLLVGDELPEYSAAWMLAELIEPHGIPLTVEGTCPTAVREWVALVRQAVTHRVVNGQ